MEPKPPVQNRGVEYGAPAGLPSIEHQAPTFTPEKGGERFSERHEMDPESVAELAQALPILPSPVAIPQPEVQQDESTQVVSDDTPLVAGDDDLIEKEWVDKAKKIVVTTKDDPYKREVEVGKLQAEYLKKRYGKELGASE